MMLADVGLAQAMSADPAALQGALCSGLADEIGRASDRQHIDRASVPAEIHVDASERASTVALRECLIGRLHDAGFAAVVDSAPDEPHDALRATIRVPEGPHADTVRVEFAISRCRPDHRFWAHPGYVDFRESQGVWSHDPARITRFIDGRCDQGAPGKRSP
jgi:hypothetical protein